MASPDNKKHFIAGYGSLRSSTSRALIPSYTEEQPVQVQIRGVIPAFNARMVFPHAISGLKRTPGETALGLVMRSHGLLEATVFQVDQSQLRSLDVRETASSKRRPIPLETIIMSDGQKLGEETIVWVYEPENPLWSNDEYPKNQSYIDAVLKGCYEAGGEEAVTSFVKTAIGWEGPWVDDRSDPQYPRAISSDKKNNQLLEFFDTVLMEYQKSAMLRRITIKDL